MTKPNRSDRTNPRFAHAAGVAEPTKLTCAQTSEQVGICSDEQGDVATPLRLRAREEELGLAAYLG